MDNGERDLREKISRTAKSLFDRGLTSGSSGNLSVRFGEGWLMTPTGSTFGDLAPERISLLDGNGDLVSGDLPTKESFLHTAIYRQRPQAGAVVHLHSLHSVAVSCLADIDPENVLPPITAYYVMKIGRLPLIPYYPPGDLDLAGAVEEKAAMHRAVMLANHGPVVSGKNLDDAVYAAEELEDTAKLYLLLHNRSVRYLTENQVTELKRRFPS
jgi:ribulose-5-phosphate 4-epimerase/fuculose-1-phosphate aldolase